MTFGWQTGDSNPRLYIREQGDTAAFATTALTDFTVDCTHVTYNNTWEWSTNTSQTLWAHDQRSSWINDDRTTILGNIENYPSSFQVSADGHFQNWTVYDPAEVMWAETIDARVRRNVARSEKSRTTEKGLALLRTILNDEEWADYRRHGSVRVMGSDGSIYEVGNGNLVYLIGIDGKAREARCWHGSSAYCLADRIACVVLALKTDPGAYARDGNVNQLHPHEAERVQARRAYGRRAA